MMKRSFIKKALFLGIIALLIPTVLIYTMQENDDDITTQETDDIDMPTAPESDAVEAMDITVAPDHVDVDEMEIQAPQQDDTIDEDDNDGNNNEMTPSDMSDTQEQPTEEQPFEEIEMSEEEITPTSTETMTDTIEYIDND